MDQWLRKILAPSVKVLMKVPNGFTVSLYVASAVVVIGLRVGNEFLISLCLHFLLCRIFSRVSSNNLLLVLTMGTIFSAEIMALRTLLPISWHAPVNLLYMLLINCFLCHYLIWSVLEFSLVDIEQEVLEIPTFSSLPTNSCLLVIMLGFSHLKKHMSLLACIVGVPTLWLCSRYKPQNHLERLWNFFMEICTAVLLNLFPFLNYIIFYFDAGEKSLCKFLVEILFLTATTNLILSQLHIQNLFSSNFIGRL
ncbi:unnamed protein product [Heterobilharzia americana]|nr:unnamed protein product [Heterobilharzia americana]